MCIRKNIYYWKCDRPNAFQHLRNNSENQYTHETEEQIREIMHRFLETDEFELNSAGGQGNHLTYLVKNHETSYFIRLENGDEKDDYMLVESEIMSQVKAQGVYVPQIFRVDVSYDTYLFSYQIMEFIEYQDLNKLKKSGKLDIFKIAREIGRNVALWQKVQTSGFGPFDVKAFKEKGKLIGYHNKYKDYYYLNLNKHLDFLTGKKFLSAQESIDIMEVVDESVEFLDIEEGCLVHKDLALWNLLGTNDELKAVVDWGDAIAGDPTDDISLFACFYAEDVLNELILGYRDVNELPDQFYSRFYLHFLRNMIVKAVIRVGGGYFDKDEDFFLIDSDMKGRDLEEFTRSRIHLACENLKNNIYSIKL